MRAHATQLAVDEAGTTFALSNGAVSPIEGVEHYRLVQGAPGPVDAAGLEDDLFGGLADRRPGPTPARLVTGAHRT